MASRPRSRSPTADRWSRAARSARRRTRSAPRNGAPARGGRQFSADSVFSTAATGDFYGTGSDDFAVGGASSDGFALGTHYSDGGHVRIYNDHGGLICSANTTEEVDSSPAVGPHPARRRLRDRHRDGHLLPGRRRTRTPSRSTTPSATRSGATRSTARRGAAPHWPTCRATTRSPWSRARPRASSGSVYALNAADRRHHLADQPARCRPRLGDHGGPDRQRRPGRDRPDRPRPLRPRRPDRPDGGPRRRRGGRWRHLTVGRDVRLPERGAGDRRMPTAPSASPSPATSR